jgi:hypothetical protein
MPGVLLLSHRPSCVLVPLSTEARERAAVRRSQARPLPAAAHAGFERSARARSRRANKYVFQPRGMSIKWRVHHPRTNDWAGRKGGAARGVLAAGLSSCRRVDRDCGRGRGCVPPRSGPALHLQKRRPAVLAAAVLLLHIRLEVGAPSSARECGGL